MEQLIQRYQSFSQREQQIILVAGIVVLIAVLYWLVWQPIVGQVPVMQQRVAAAEDGITTIKAQLAEYQQLTHSSSGAASRRGNQSLNNAVTSTANRYRITINDLKSQPNKPDELAVYIDLAEFDQVLLWLQEIERYYQIETISFDVDQIEDKPGFVKARIKFKDQA